VNKQLRHTNIDLDNFINAATHDLKSPIANIEGLMQLLFDALPQQVLADQGLEGIAEMIGQSIARFNRTISHLTEVVKLQKENNQEPVVIDLATVIRDIQLDLASELKATGTHLEVEVAGCPDVSFSEKNMRSIVCNLLSNAIKYRSPEQTPAVCISCRQEGGVIAISVKDNGLGIELSGNQKLFTMFSRFHDHVEGSGIGLYMVKRMVENGGDILRWKARWAKVLPLRYPSRHKAVRLYPYFYLW
jgi:signal transduction histidine kinase